MVWGDHMSFTVYSDNYEYHIKLNKEQVGNYVILPGDPGRCEAIAKYLSDAQFITSNREYTTYTGYLNDEKVSVVSTGIGGPSASIALEELVHLGAHTFIRVGTCGGMNENVLPSDLIIATGAIRQEGTTREYAPIEYPAVSDFYVTTALKDASDELKIKSHLGVVQSKDSFYGQHSPETMPVNNKLKSDWDAWIKCGALASEMEAASLFIVGSIRRVRVGAVLTVMGNQTRREQGITETICHDSDNAIKTAILAMKKIIENDKK